MEENPDPTPQPTAPAMAPEAGARRGRVLVAEDNALIQVVTVTTLAILGHDADVVADGRQAVEAVARNDYVAVFMDCQMPEMDGYQATAEICVVRSKADTDSGAIRTPVPVESGHSFRLIPDT